MLLRDNLYKIVSRDPALPGSFDIALLPDSFIFKAHFPGMPVTPGVCIIQMALELLGIAVGRPVSLRQVKNAKFLSVITADVSPLTVQLRNLSASDDIVSVQAEIKDSTTIYAKLSLKAALA